MSKKTAYLSMILIAAAALAYADWLHQGVTSTKWAIDLVGGEDTLANSADISGEDINFIKSLQIRQTHNQATSAFSNTSCNDFTLACLDNNLSIANVLAISGKDFQIAKEFIDIYSSMNLEPCPLKTEISQLVYETSHLAASKNQQHATTLLNKIKLTGGLKKSIQSETCQQYKKSHPHLARAYLFYLSTLIEMSDFAPDSAWLYLLYKSGHEI